MALFAQLLHLQSLSQERSLCIQGQRLPGRHDDLLSVLFFPQEHPFPFVLGDSSISAYQEKDDDNWIILESHPVFT